MFANLFCRLKALRKQDDDGEDKLRRQARLAEKQITRTATRELSRWHQKHGYSLPPSSHEPEDDANAVDSSSTPEQSLILTPVDAHQREHSITSTQEAPQPLSKPPAFIEYRPFSSTATELSRLQASSPSLGLHALDSGLSLSAEASKELPFLDTTLDELKQKETLLAEIQKIRANIAELRGSSLASNSPRLSPTSPSSAPWLTTQRDEDEKVARLRWQRTKSVADVFAQDSPRDEANAAPQLPDLDTLATTRLERRRSKSAGAGVTRRRQSVQPTASSKTEHPPPKMKHQSLDVDRAGPSKSRQIVISPQEAKIRYSAALGRTSTTDKRGRDSPSLRQSMASDGPHQQRPPSSRRSSKGTMSLSELQARHQAKLRELQRVVTQKLSDQEEVDKVKREWVIRLAREKADQVAKDERLRRGRSNSQASMGSMLREARRNTTGPLPIIAKHRPITPFSSSESNPLGKSKLSSNSVDAPLVPGRSPLRPRPSTNPVSQPH